MITKQDIEHLKSFFCHTYGGRERRIADGIDAVLADNERLRRELDREIAMRAALYQEVDSELCDCAHTKPCGSVCSWCKATSGTRLAGKAGDLLAELERLRAASRNQTGCDCNQKGCK